MGMELTATDAAVIRLFNSYYLGLVRFGGMDSRPSLDMKAAETLAEMEGVDNFKQFVRAISALTIGYFTPEQEAGEGEQDQEDPNA